MNILYIFLFIVEVLSAYLFYRFVFLRHRRMAYVYPLYEVRDKLIYLVATGKLKEGDYVFQEFYKAVNIIIPNSKQITLKTLVQSLLRAKKKGYDPASSKVYEKIEKDLKRINDPEVNKVVRLFYTSVFSLLVKNSILLRLARFEIALKLKQVFSTIATPFQKDMWQEYRSYGRATNSLC